MVALSTPCVNLGFIAPYFRLLSVDENYCDIDDCFGEKGLLVMFICNHCPYVKSIITHLVYDIKTLKGCYNINSVAIMPNDTKSYPQDSYDAMKVFAKENEFCFPYLIDEDQNVATKYGAVCTPDFFGFNKDRKLCYRGRYDSSGMNKRDRVGNSDLLNAMVFISNTSQAPQPQYPSIGCSIKWISDLSVSPNNNG